MREIMYLTGYEYQKIFRKHSTWIALILVFVWAVISGFGGIIGDYYVDGEKPASHYQRIRTQREALEHLEIRELNEEFFRKEKEISKSLLQPQEELLYSEQAKGNRAEYWMKYYENYAPYDNFYMLLNMMEMQVGKIDQEKMTAEDFYRIRKIMMEYTGKDQKLSEGELAFHMKQNEQIKTPYAYGNMLGYDSYFQILASDFILLAFAAAVILAPMFAGEYTSHMDGLVLSSRYGKNKLIYAKLLTGISFAFFSSVILSGILLLEIQAIYGLGDWNLPIQVSLTGCYLSLPVNLLEFLGIITGCCVISTCMTSMFVLFCSVNMKSPFGVIIVSFAFIFVPVVLIYAVNGHRLLFMIINSMPSSMVFPGSVAAHQLISVGNHYFYFFQWVPAVYLCLMGLLSWWIFRSFRNHQVR